MSKPIGVVSFDFHFREPGGREVGTGALWESPFSQKQESDKKEFKFNISFNSVKH